MLLVQVIVATNIAETSVTLEGMVYVVDCCYSKQLAYNPWYEPSSVYLSELGISRWAYHGGSQSAGNAPAALPADFSACLLVHTGAAHALHWSSKALFCSCSLVHHGLGLRQRAYQSQGDQAWPFF